LTRPCSTPCGRASPPARSRKAARPACWRRCAGSSRSGSVQRPQRRR
jgi:hypothetical protein